MRESDRASKDIELEENIEETHSNAHPKEQQTREIEEDRSRMGLKEKREMNEGIQYDLVVVGFARFIKCDSSSNWKILCE